MTSLGPVFYVDSLYVPNMSDIKQDIHDRYFCGDLETGFAYVNKILETYRENVDEENLVVADWLPEVRALVAAIVIEVPDTDSYICFRFEIKAGFLNIDFEDDASIIQ